MDRRAILKTSLPMAAAGTSITTTAAAAAANSPQAQSKVNPVSALTENLNPEMQKYRDAALAVLKPSAAELERGLELHANSVVFDSYGFSPRSAIDGEALKQAAMAGASDMELKDMREAMMMTRCATDAGERAEFEAAWKASGAPKQAIRPAKDRIEFFVSVDVRCRI